MSATDTGRIAEKRVEKQLISQKYKIRDTNWRNRWCEIDIIAEKDDVVYFIEVKFRAKAQWGDGFDAVGRNKLHRMTRAAEAWVTEKKWTGEYELQVAAVDTLTIEIRSLY